MKKWLILMLLMVPCYSWANGLLIGGSPPVAGGGGTITFKGVAENPSGETWSSISTLTTLNVALHDTVLIFVAFDNPPNGDPAVTCGTDSATKIKTATVGEYYVEAWLVANASANAAAAVTANWGGDTGYVTICAVSYSGVANTNTVDVSSCNSVSCDTVASSSSNRTAQSVTTTNANDLLVFYTLNYNNNGTFTGSNSFTRRTATGTLYGILDRIVASTGSFPGTAATDGADTYITIFVALKGA